MKLILREIAGKIPIVLAVLATVATSGIAVNKVYKEFVDKNEDLVEISSDTNTVDTNNTSSPENSKTETATANDVNPSSGVTLAELATHDKSGDCYVAYNGVVYNVSNHYAWNGCSHHGISGGSDITSRFPHPTSYLSGLPVVGNLSSDQTTTGNSSGKNSVNGDNDDDYEEEIEYEYEEMEVEDD